MTQAIPADRTGLEPAEMERLERALVRLVRTAMHPSHQFESGMDKAGYVVLINLLRGGSVRQTDLAASMGLDLSTVSRQVRHLEELGFVRRDADPADGRAQVLAVTAAGRREVSRQRQARWAAVGDRLALVPPADRDRFLDFLELLAADATAARDAAVTPGRTTR